jgi:lipopolysaccharide transport system ATP-binding protein
MKPIIEVKNLWKEYHRGAQKEKYLSLRENLFRRVKSNKKDTFWALSDINFKVDSGDSLAIIGKNGAGKSTLLKILSKITPPTKGEIVLRGRLASLLEVGTGFHAELTGRENIYLNGSILGLTRQEINSQFDAIVDFSGVEPFLETPLKRYSSGMQLRLAFAVAAHLEPEILVIDEVLAVGDAQFQRKCLNKMTEVSQSGRTIIFVSHNLSAVSNLCDKALLINDGEIISEGRTPTVIDQYFNLSKSGFQKTKDIIDGVHISHVRINDEDSNFSVLQGRNCKIDFAISNPNSEGGNFEIAAAIKDYAGHYLIYFGSQLKDSTFTLRMRNKNELISLVTGSINLRPGNYLITLELKLNGEIVYKENDAIELSVLENDFYGTGRKWMNQSLVWIEQEWSQK